MKAFVKFPAELLGIEWARPTTFAVYLALKRHVDPRKTSGKAWPGRSKIARLARVSVRTVQHEINVLRQHGWLDWKSRWVDPKRKLKGTNIYIVRDEPLSVEKKQMRQTREASSLPLEKQAHHPEAGIAPEVRTNEQEPNEQEPIRLAASQPSHRVSMSKSYPDQFECSWALYPKRAGGNSKRAAFRAWSARVRSGVEETEIHAGVERYAAYCEATRKVGTEYVKQASTFFGPNEHYLETWTPQKTDSRGDQRLYPSAEPVKVRSF